MEKVPKGNTVQIVSYHLKIIRKCTSHDKKLN
jgi:hypothetical protein